MQLDAGSARDLDLYDPTTCATCHPDHYREWSGSMHAYASFDPVFIAMNQRGQRETNGALGDFCVQCHAPLAVALGKTTDGLNLAELPTKYQGIGCIYCHSVSGLGTDGHNNDLIVDLNGPLRGAVQEPIPTEAHVTEYSTLFDRGHRDSSALCGHCHDVRVPSGLLLEQTYLEWQSSLYGQQGTNCAVCHMPGYESPISTVPDAPVRQLHSHSMAAVDVALTPFVNERAQRLAVQAELDPTVSAELCVSLTSTSVQVEVALRNRIAGHAFPSGSSQDRRAILELTAYQGSSLLFTDTSWRFGREMLDAEGRVVLMFWDAHATEGDVLPAPLSFDPSDELYEQTFRRRSYRFIGQPDRVEIRLHLYPVDPLVLEELVSSGDLDPEIITKMPRFTLGNTELLWSPNSPPCVRSSLR